MMKRFLTILACLMLLCLPALADVADLPLADSGFVGVWVETDGYGTLTLYADGVAVMEYYDGTVTNTTWGPTDDGYRFGEGMWYNSPMILRSEDVLDVSNGWMVFTRDGIDVEVPEAELDLVPVGEEGEPFCGAWRLDAIVIDGESYSPALIGMAMDFTLTADGLATIVIDGEETHCTWCVSGPAVLIDVDMFLPDEEGRLVLSDESAAMIFVRVPEEPAPADPAAPAASDAAAEDFFGAWQLYLLEAEGESFPAVLFDMSMYISFAEDGTATIFEDGESSSASWEYTDGQMTVDGVLLFIDVEDRLILSDESAAMIFIRAESVPEAPAATSDDDADDQSPFVGQWYMCYCQTGGLTGDLRTMGLTATLTLFSDGTGMLTGIADEYGPWYEDEGVTRFGESGMPLTLLGDPDAPFLQYGSTQGGYMIFSQDESAQWDPSLLSADEPAAPPADVPASTPAEGGVLTGVRYVCTSFTSAGFTMDAANLGAEYAFLLHEGGTADLTIAGFSVAGLPCTFTPEGACAIDYYGNPIICTPTAAGVDMDYLGAMILHLVPAE